MATNNEASDAKLAGSMGIAFGALMAAGLADLFNKPPWFYAAFASLIALFRCIQWWRAN